MGFFPTFETCGEADLARVLSERQFLIHQKVRVKTHLDYVRIKVAS